VVIPADWKEVRLGEICEFVKTIALSRSQLEADHGVGCIHYGDIHTKFNDRLDCSNVRLPMAEAGLVVGIPRLKVGDLVIADASEDMTGVGKGIEILGIPEYGVVAGLHTAVLRPQVGYFSKGFLGQLQHMPKFREQARVFASGLKVYGLSKTSISKISVDIPPLKEQEAIAEALSDADAAIESIDSLIAKKRDVKQATMQQLLTGRTRLPGFNADWKEVSIGSFTDCKAGGTPSTSVPAYWGGNIRWMSSGELNLKRVREVSGRITQFGLENSSAQLFPADSVLIGLAGQGKTRGTAAINLVSLTTNQSIAAIFPSSRHDSKFLFYVMETKYKELRDLSDGGGGRGGLNLAIIKDVRVTVPELDEQKKISEVLWSMDDELEALTEQVSKLRMVKEGMMQDLLTGKVRLV
jgi:type I restriction enzyme S subunit